MQLGLQIMNRKIISYLITLVIICVLFIFFVERKPQYFKCLTESCNAIFSNRQSEASTFFDIHKCSITKDGTPHNLLVIWTKGEGIKCPLCGQEIKQTAHNSLLPNEHCDLLAMSDRTMEKRGFVTISAKIRQVHKILKPTAKVAYDPELYEAEGQYIQANQSLKAIKEENKGNQALKAKETLNRVRQRLVHMGLDNLMINRIDQMSVPERNLIYTEPMGQAWVYANIYENEAALVKPGDVVELELPKLAGKTIRGNVYGVDTFIEPLTRTVRVRALIDNKEGSLNSGTTVDISIIADTTDSYVISPEAVWQNKGLSIILVEISNGLFEIRKVDLGNQTQEGYYQIQHGISAEDKILADPKKLKNINKDAETLLLVQ